MAPTVHDLGGRKRAFRAGWEIHGGPFGSFISTQGRTLHLISASETRGEEVLPGWISFVTVFDCRKCASGLSSGLACRLAGGTIMPASQLFGKCTMNHRR